VSYILNIDTAVETASVCLSFDTNIIALKENPSQKEGAAWIQQAIKELMEAENVALSQLSAIAVSSGPGSYTGLRVGMATAKGLCYALKLPLITINTLQMMAVSAQTENAGLLCPMIDARRAEVFTALYDENLAELMAPQALILNESSFEDVLRQNRIVFFGNGSVKFSEMINSSNAAFVSINTSAKHLVPLSYKSLKAALFADLAYSEPFYGKAFYSPPSKPVL